MAGDWTWGHSRWCDGGERRGPLEGVGVQCVGGMEVLVHWGIEGVQGSCGHEVQGGWEMEGVWGSCG